MKKFSREVKSRRHCEAQLKVDLDLQFHIKLVRLSEYKFFFSFYATHLPNLKSVIEILSLNQPL
jgi:hypothetical protein